MCKGTSKKLEKNYVFDCKRPYCTLETNYKCKDVTSYVSFLPAYHGNRAHLNMTP